MIATITPAPGTLLALVESLAAAHGWHLASATETADNANGRRLYTRDGERVHLRTWPGTGGVPALTAELAAGRVSTREFRREWSGHNVANRDIVEAFTGPRAATPDVPAGCLPVPGRPGNTLWVMLTPSGSAGCQTGR